MIQHLNYKGLRRRVKKGAKKIFEEIIVENFPMGKEIANQVPKAQSPIQDKSKEK